MGHYEHLKTADIGRLMRTHNTLLSTVIKYSTMA